MELKRTVKVTGYDAVVELVLGDKAPSGKKKGERRRERERERGRGRGREREKREKKSELNMSIISLNHAILLIRLFSLLFALNGYESMNAEYKDKIRSQLKTKKKESDRTQ